jgi:16S rRNA (guanine966-N2)-methyltransferase
VEAQQAAGGRPPRLRPTPDRVRETLFNWLGQDLTGWRVLDAFAGSGALGFEAASRGAAEVVLLERDAAGGAACKPASSACRPRRCASACRRTGLDGALRAGRFDLVLLDPPFDAGLLAAAWPPPPRWCQGGLLYLESPAALAPADTPPGLSPGAGRRPAQCTIICCAGTRGYTRPIARPRRRRRP